MAIYKYLKFYDKTGDNINLDYDEANDTWTGKMYFPRVATDLHENEHIFIEMVLLHDDTFRINMDQNGALKAIKVMAGDKAAGLKSRNVVLNNDKTPSHWITAKHIYFPMMFNDIGAAIKALPDIKWN